MTSSIATNHFRGIVSRNPDLGSRSMRNTLTTLLSLLCVVGSLALTELAVAKTYKWVDEDGVTQYTATPPPTGDFKTLTPPPKPAVDPVKAQGDFEKRLEAFNKRQEETSKTKKQADEQAAKSAAAKKDCEQAKKNLNLLQAKVRIRYTDKDGTVRYLTDEEREAKLKNANDDIKSFCKK